MKGSDRAHPGIRLIGTDAEGESLLFGFWIFLMSDLVLFAVLFAIYAAMSQHGIADGPAPADVFELRNPFIESCLLLASSFTFGLASLALKYREDRRQLSGWLLLTLALGGAFMALEVMDFVKFVAEGHTPQRSGFLSAYFVLVGTHGLHVAAAMIWGLIMLVQLVTLGLVHPVKTRLLRLALFWHMLDIVWVSIFTFVYLFGVLE